MRRRSLLVGLGATLAGCGTRERSAPESTLTPAEVPATDSPGPTDLAPAAAESRFDGSTPVPTGVVLYHRLPEDFDVGVVPSRERFSPATTGGSVRVLNRKADPVYVSRDWSLAKYTGHRWVRVPAPRVYRSGVAAVEPGGGWDRDHRITDLFGLPVLGPGLYARLESARTSSDGGEIAEVGALFEVQETTAGLEPDREIERRDGDTAFVEGASGIESEVVFERAADAESADARLVTEVVGSVPMLRNGIGHLESASTVRVPSRSSALVFNYLEGGTVRAGSVDETTRLEHDGIRFTVRLKPDR